MYKVIGNDSGNPNDAFDTPLEVGDEVIRPQARDSVPFLVISTVTKVENGRVYLDGSKQPLRYPGRCMKIGMKIDWNTDAN